MRTAFSLSRALALGSSITSSSNSSATAERLSRSARSRVSIRNQAFARPNTETRLAIKWLHQEGIFAVCPQSQVQAVMLRVRKLSLIRDKIAVTSDLSAERALVLVNRSLRAAGDEPRQSNSGMIGWGVGDGKILCPRIRAAGQIGFAN